MSVGGIPQLGVDFVRSISRDGQEAELHATGNRTDGDAVNHLVIGEIILSVTVFLGGVNISKNDLRYIFHNLGGTDIDIADAALDILLFIR